MPERKKDPEDKLFAVIMAGGKGTRFWPLSRETFPKQFLKLMSERTLIQDTIHRLEGLVAPENTIIVTTENQKGIVAWQAKELLGEVNCIVEPEGRNTAPAIALVAFKLRKKSKDALMLVLPSDHFIGDTEGFVSTVRSAVPFAEKGRLITFGIQPTKPETGYGYIKAGRKASGGVFNVSRFVEKPDRKTAEGYLEDGSYYWNSGMFLFRASDIIEEIKSHMPDIYSAFQNIEKDIDTEREEKALRKIYKGLREESIDYGVMEKSANVSMAQAGFPWSDIGSWDALEEVMDRDGDGNVAVGNVVGMDCGNSIFFAGDRLVAAIGLRDMVVVDTTDATLIVPKDRVQMVKNLVGKLKDEGKEEFLVPKIEERPWGYFSVLEQGAFHKIKHIFIKPKGRLSLQMHNHRSEHWIVVSGTAKVQRGEEVLHVHQNESTFIPATYKHRLENPGIIPLRIIEIQSGEYLGEDDIIRFDDVYGRDTK
jgi:mannose-1-phosphate guanylyltransferase/mannose-6-phosphate isomerase